MRKSIAIIGEGETEWFYFEAKLSEGYDYVVYLIDMDRFHEKPAEMKKYQSFKARKENRGIMFIETSPCTEFWFLLHFLPNNAVRYFKNYDQLIPELRKYMPEYEKTRHYFKRTKLYEYLRDNGDIDVRRPMRINWLR